MSLLNISNFQDMRYLLLIAAIFLSVSPLSAESVYDEFLDTLRLQQDQGCDTSYVGGYVSLYQSLILLCDLSKNSDIARETFDKYASEVIDVLGSGDATNIKAALMYARRTCGEKGIELPVNLEMKEKAERLDEEIKGHSMAYNEISGHPDGIRDDKRACSELRNSVVKTEVNLSLLKEYKPRVEWDFNLRNGRLLLERVCNSRNF